MLLDMNRDKNIDFVGEESIHLPLDVVESESIIVGHRIQGGEVPAPS